MSVVKRNWRAGRTVGQVGFLWRLLLLAAFFVGGVIAGQVLSARVSAEAVGQLRRYLADFLRVEENRTLAALGATALIYFRYPLLAVLLAFTVAGVVLLPCAAAVLGALLSFSVCCFTLCFGSGGVLLALAVLGLRCLVTLPCFFLLAADGWSASAALGGLSFGRGRPAAVGISWPRICGAAAVLTAGICVEWSLLPGLVRFVLARVLI